MCWVFIWVRVAIVEDILFFLLWELRQLFLLFKILWGFFLEWGYLWLISFLFLTLYKVVTHCWRIGLLIGHLWGFLFCYWLVWLLVRVGTGVFSSISLISCKLWLLAMRFLDKRRRFLRIAASILLTRKVALQCSLFI